MVEPIVLFKVPNALKLCSRLERLINYLVNWDPLKLMWWWRMAQLWRCTFDTDSHWTKDHKRLKKESSGQWSLNERLVQKIERVVVHSSLQTCLVSFSKKTQMNKSILMHRGSARMQRPNFWNHWVRIWKILTLGLHILHPEFQGMLYCLSIT